MSQNQFNLDGRSWGGRCPGCIAAYMCGSVSPMAILDIEPHFEAVHGWTRAEVQHWLDTSQTPRRAHLGPGWGDFNDGNVSCPTCSN